jgi:hypothetical protein
MQLHRLLQVRARGALGASGNWRQDEEEADEDAKHHGGWEASTAPETAPLCGCLRAYVTVNRLGRSFPAGTPCTSSTIISGARRRPLCFSLQGLLCSYGSRALLLHALPEHR